LKPLMPLHEREGGRERDSESLGERERHRERVFSGSNVHNGGVQGKVHQRENDWHQVSSIGEEC
jgi:hypothetical protein